MSRRGIKNSKLFRLIYQSAACGLIAILVLPVIAYASETSGTIDSTNAYAWSENMGWINFGTSEGSVSITDSSLSGYAWGENIGWISLNCANDDSCGTSDYSVANDGEGSLSGYAWGENIGWINFNPSGGGVTIDSSGTFSGYAWGENIGWIVFNCATTDTCATTDYIITTDWRPQSARSSNDTESSSGGTEASSEESGPDPISEPNAAPILGFLSRLITTWTDKDTGKTITVQIYADITVITKPVDADRLKSLTLTIGKDIYKLKPTGEDPNNPTYTTTIKFTSIGFKAYTLRADYGITDRKEKGQFLVIGGKQEETPAPIELLTPTRQTISFSLPQFAPELEFGEVEVIPAPDEEQQLEPQFQPTQDKPLDTAQGKPPLTAEALTVFDKLGLVITDIFNFVTRTATVFVKTALNPSSTTNPRIPDRLRDHRYEEVQIRIALADGTPLSGAHLTLLSEPKEAITDDQGFASFQDVEIGEHTLKIAFGKFKGEQKLFFKDDVAELLVNVTPNIINGVHPLATIGIALATLLIGGTLIYFFAKRRFTGHFVV